MLLRRATPGSAASTWATAPTAASSCSTGATPASATSTTASTAPRAGSTRSPTASPPRRRQSATCRSSTSAPWSTLHRHPNEWFVRQARRVLADRSARGEPLDEAGEALRSALRPGPRPGRASSGPSGRCTPSAGPTTPSSARLLGHEHESVRAWAIRLLTDDMPLDTIFSQRIGAGRRAAGRPAGEARRAWPATIARGWSGWCWPRRSSGCRWPARARWPRPLLAHREDAADHNLPP